MSNQSEANWKASMANFRWASSPQSQPATSSSSGGASERTGFLSGFSGYIPLRSNARTNEEEAFFALSRWERLLGFIICCLGGAACFAIGFFIGLPLILIKPSKFAVAFCAGSLLVMLGFVILNGPVNQAKHLFSRERLPFTAAYLLSLFLTLYFALVSQSYFGTLVAGLVQVVALVSYFVAYFPGGIQTLRFGGQIALRGASNLLPV
ncbi:SFT2-domain-containing protein [Atractiella rhizophila]|nr:SFT2-domain-containing protein [Atractiella rhizophila]